MNTQASAKERGAPMSGPSHAEVKSLCSSLEMSPDQHTPSSPYNKGGHGGGKKKGGKKKK